ncbi:MULTISPECIES: ABC-type transport auxiliary lipoprotein family protein [Paracoccus]|nr:MULTISPECIES: ABC-type transport auxiliary lipoprotein family protein [Paracoccus]
MMRLTVALLVLTMTLPGCAALSALKGEPDRDVFELRPPSDVPRQCGQGRRAELVIEPPKTRGTLDTDRIMIRPNELQTQYLPDARWGDTVPVTLQTLLVRGFGVYDAFTHVGRAPLGTSGDYALISEINDFNAEVVGQGAIIRLSVNAQMVNEMDARVVSRGRFTATAEAPTTRTADLIPAFDAAGQQLVTQMTDWGLRAVGVNPARCR